MFTLLADGRSDNLMTSKLTFNVARQGHEGSPEVVAQLNTANYSATTGLSEPLPFQWSAGGLSNQVAMTADPYWSMEPTQGGADLHAPAPSPASCRPEKGAVGNRMSKSLLGSEWVTGSDSSSEHLEYEDDIMSNGSRRPGSGRKGPQKKVGRPIAFTGDPNSPNLTEAERRRIKRRIANRESARRVRSKRLEELGDMQCQLEEVHHRNQELKAQAHKAEAQKAKLFEQMEVLEHSFKSRTAENMALHDEIHGLRQKVQAKMSKLENDLDNCVQGSAPATQAPMQASAFSYAPWPSSFGRDTNAEGLEEHHQGLRHNLLQNLPSLNLDPMPSRAASLDRLNDMLNGA